MVTITTDRDYARSREENALTEKPKDFVEGFGFGSKAALTGFASGISGIFTRPFIMAKNKGVVGFFKGTYQAATGVFLKPASGVLDMFSKTAEGCKNTLLVFERKTSFSRARQPRPFYGYKNVIKKFNPSHALLTNNILFELQQGEF
jgi:vacuolar protein sorting-associated protein 13A/C